MHESTLVWSTGFLGLVQKTLFAVLFLDVFKWACLVHTSLITPNPRLEYFISWSRHLALRSEVIPICFILD